MSWWACSAQPALTVSMRPDWARSAMTVSMRPDWESICTIPKPFYSEKLPYSSDLMKGKSNHVDDADFSSPLSAIMFSSKMRMERLRFCEVENNTTDT